MITQAIVTALGSALTFMLGLVPSITLPDWLTGAAASVSSFLGPLSGIALWVNVSAAGQCIAFVLACFGVALGAKLARIVLSVGTGGGGSAA